MPCRGTLNLISPESETFPPNQENKSFLSLSLNFFSPLFMPSPLPPPLPARGCRSAGIPAGSATCSGTRKVRKRGRTDSGYCELLGQRESEQGSGGGSPECAAVRKHRRFSEASSSRSRRGSDTVALGEAVKPCAPFLERARASPWSKLEGVVFFFFSASI